MAGDSFEASLIPNAPYMKQVAPNFGMHNMVNDSSVVFVGWLRSRMGSWKNFIQFHFTF